MSNWKLLKHRKNLTCPNCGLRNYCSSCKETIEKLFPEVLYKEIFYVKEKTLNFFKEKRF